MVLFDVFQRVSGKGTNPVAHPSWAVLCCNVYIGLSLFSALPECHALGLPGTTVAQLGVSARLELRADELRMRSVRMQVPELTLLDHTGRSGPGEGPWRVTVQGPLDSPDLWKIRLEQTTDAVRRQIEYLVWTRSDAANTTHLEPVMATETALDVDTGARLFQAQTVAWSIKDLARGAEQVADLARVAPWVRAHLDQVFNTDILDACAEHLWHNSLEPGFAGVIACTNRRIELAPQVIEPYTTNAWLMWSAWVAWKLDPKKVPNGKDQAHEAIRLLKKGRAANPHSAAYHLDAAETIAPLARHHLPELMDFVIQYYLYADELATDRDMQIRIRKGLGHRYREQDKIPQATHWYRAVLDLDPDNKVALRYLKKFGAEPYPDKPQSVEAD